MAVTDAQYQRLLNRVTALENSFNDVAVAIENFLTRSQYNQLSTLIQTQIDDLSTTVTELEARVTSIEEEPIT